MAKRFSDTELWDKDWFMPLPQKQKLLFQFLFSKCDAAGVWSPNYILASTYIGSKVTKDDLKSLKNQVEILPDGKIFLVDFIEFQYGKLTETCMPHRKIIALLKKHELFERVSKGYQKTTSSLEEEDKEEVKDEEEEKDPAQKNPELNFPFKSEAFLSAWSDWETYKQDQHKFKFKSPLSEQRSLNLLFKESHESEAEAIAMLDYAMAKGWQGWVPKDDVNFYSGGKAATVTSKKILSLKDFDSKSEYETYCAENNIPLGKIA